MSETIKDKLSLIELYFSLKGRISRLQFAAFYLLPLLLVSELAAYSVIFAIFRDYLSIMMMGKRARDINLPLWFPVIVYASLIGIYQFYNFFPFGEGIFAILFLLIPTKKKDNLYGNSCEIHILNKGTDHFLKKGLSASIDILYIALMIILLLSLDYIYAPDIKAYSLFSVCIAVIFFLSAYFIEQNKIKLSLPFRKRLSQQIFFTHPAYLYKVILALLPPQAIIYSLLRNVFIKTPIELINVADYLLGFFACMSALMMLLTWYFYTGVSSDHIQGYNSWCIKNKCRWGEIKSAKFKNLLFLFPYYYLYDERGKCLIAIPYKGFIKNNTFKESVMKHAGGDHPLSKLIKEHE